jgi:hypothetical protein
VKELLGSYSQPGLDPAQAKAVHAFMLHLAQKAGMDQLPAIDAVNPNA